MIFNGDHLWLRMEKSMVHLWLMMRKPGVGWLAIPYAPITCWLLRPGKLYCMNWPTRKGHLWCGILEMEFSTRPYQNHPRAHAVVDLDICIYNIYIYYVRVWYIYMFGCANQARVCTFVLHIWYCKSLQQHGVKVQTHIEGGCFIHHHVRTMFKNKTHVGMGQNWRPGGPQILVYS